ncbi:Acriflavin resistance plasma membrane protein [Granulibacter bethesdensis]|nr:Acriflavin resistance plasma membrane protein [Granulibacter bethesdensis]
MREPAGMGLKIMGSTALLTEATRFCRRHTLWVVLAAMVLAGFSLTHAAHHLGVSTNTDELFSPSLPWRQRQVAYEKNFPQNQDLLVAVVDGSIPEEAEATADALTKALSEDKEHFLSVQQPGALPYFQKEGLLFLDQKSLSSLLDQTIDAQPFLGQLTADPSARGLFAALSLVAMGVSRGEANLQPFMPALQGFDDALRQAAEGHPKPLSWENLLAGPLAQQAGQYRFVLAQPRLDYDALEPGGAATAVLRHIAAGLEFVRTGHAHVRITGPVALADEEFSTVAHGMVEGTLISIALITLWLFLALRSWRLILPVLATLMLGLTLTIGFASVAVGTLNLVSVAFAILFVGIAVDFAIQYCVRFREVRHEIADPAISLPETTRRVGGQILVAAAATAAGFLAFVPTSFEGVAELGLIAGVGMVIAFLCTMTFLPAMLSLFHPRAEGREIGFAVGIPLDRTLLRWRRPVLLVFALIAASGIALLSRLTFDSDPLHTKNPNTEAMRTLYGMMGDPMTNPYSADILVANREQAEALAKKLEKLPTVAEVLTLSSFVPDNQDEKLALVADAASLLGPTLTPHTPPSSVTPEQIRLAISAALGQIRPALAKLPANHPLAGIAAALDRLSHASDETLLAANAALVRFLPMQLERLRTALSAEKVSVKDIPPALAKDWQLPDGRVRVQAMTSPKASDSAGLHRFAAEVLAVAPDASGSAIVIVETAQTIVTAFRHAAMGAIAAIMVILALALRRVLDAALVMSALLLSALMTVVVISLLPMALNFANIIALPLLLGVGVSFNIYFVMNWRAGVSGFLATATARAVIFSALTTATAFGSLALSEHPGTASMGNLLMISLGCTLVASLIYIPALLSGLRRRGQA